MKQKTFFTSLSATAFGSAQSSYATAMRQLKRTFFYQVAGIVAILL